MATSSITVTSQPTLVYSGGLKDALIQNSATGSNVFFSDTPNLTSSSYSIQLLPGTPLEWPAGSPLWAICAPGSSSTVTVLDNGSSLGVSVSALQSAINALIAVTSASANPQPNYVNAVAANTLYDASLVMVTGIYVVSCASGVVANVDFYDANNVYITTATTVSGTITLNIASAVATIKFWTTSGTNTQIEILKQGSSIAPVSGTLTTVTASGTPGIAGDAYVLLVGGGGGGGGTLINGGAGGGGGSGGITGGRKLLLGTETLTIGVGGNGGAAAGSGTGVAGTATTFAGFTANGGNGGGNDGGVGGVGGTPGGANGGNAGGTLSGVTGSTGTNANTIFSFFTQGAVGGGGGGGQSGAGGAGGSGSFIGGAGTTPGGNGNNASGYGGGGGGAGYNASATGGKGGNGVLYIII